MAIGDKELPKVKTKEDPIASLPSCCDDYVEARMYGGAPAITAAKDRDWNHVSFVQEHLKVWDFRTLALWQMKTQKCGGEGMAYMSGEIGVA